jgi:hypothetical protein
MFAANGESEKALRQLPHFSSQFVISTVIPACIPVAGHAAFALNEAGRRNFASAVLGCFPEDLVALAQNGGDAALLETLCRASGIPEPVIKAAAALPTATHAFEILHEYSPRKHAAVVQLLAKQAAAFLKGAAEDISLPSLTLYAFDGKGRLLAKAYT